MAEHVLQTNPPSAGIRIQLRYDTYSNWMNSDLILKQGEAAICAFPQEPPALSLIGIKVGDGTHYFYELPWIQAAAADVYNWAKSSTKPTYDASEITNLDTYIEQHSSSTGGGGDGTVTPRLYQLYKTDQDKYYLQYKTEDSDGWIVDTNTYIDLYGLTQVLNWIGPDLTKYISLGNRTAEHIAYEVGKLNYSDDTAQTGYYVSKVTETSGKIAVERQQLNHSNISGTVSVPHGGTGLTTIPVNEVLVGNGENNIRTIPIANVIDNNTNLVPNYLVKNYVDKKTEGLTGAMHFIGEATVIIDNTTNSTVDPRIEGYDFSQASRGDVILSNRAEYVWTGSYWRLLGDEGSYAVKGSIKDVDIDADAEIQQSKILNLTNTLASKVDKVYGKQLSTNDYTNEEKNKLESISPGAQVNAIEHIFVNDIERPIVVIDGKPKSVALSIDVFDEAHATKLDNIENEAQVNVIEHIFVNGEEQIVSTVNDVAKSVNITFIPFTEYEQQKLQNIEPGAEVNKINSIKINNQEYFPNEDRQINITIDQEALNLNVVAGAEIPKEDSTGREEIEQIQKKLQFERIAVSGNVKDLIQDNNKYIILDCGNSVDVID